MGQPLPVVTEHAPDALLTARRGSALSLAALWAEGPLVLVFLRQPGCVFARQVLAELRAALPEFEARGAVVAVVMPMSPAAIPAVTASVPARITLLVDPSGAAYEAYGIRRGTLLELGRPSVIVAGLQAMLAGHLPGLPRGDACRLGGAFVIGTDGRLRYVHRGRDAADNPSLDRLTAVLAALAAHPPAPS